MPLNKPSFRDRSSEEKLLRVEFDKYSSVPKIIYKGEEITKIIEFKIDWKTDTTIPLLPTIIIKYVEGTGKDMSVKTIKHNDVGNQEEIITFADCEEVSREAYREVSG